MKFKCWKPSSTAEKVLLIVLITSIFVVTVLLLCLILTTKSENKESCTSKACLEAAFGILSNIDSNADPCVDFYQFACGNYSPQNNMFEESVKNDVDKKMFKNLEQITEIIQQGWVAKPKYYKLLTDFFNSCINTPKLEDIGLNPLIETFTKVGGWPVLQGSDWNEEEFQWEQILMKFRNMGIPTNAFFSLTVDTDFTQPGNHILAITELGLGLPQASYYKDKSILEQYLKLMIELASILGAERSRAESEMRHVLEFEKKLAETRLPTEEYRDISHIYNQFTINQLEKLMPQFPWLEFIRINVNFSKVTGLENVIVAAPNALKNISNILSQTKKRVVANYMLWKFVREHCHLLDTPIANKCMKFKEQLLGDLGLSNRKRHCMFGLIEHFDLASSAVFVENLFNVKTKKMAKDIAMFIKKELSQGIRNAEWMDSETRKAANEKVEEMKEYIAYPPELLNETLINNYYERLSIHPEEYFYNKLRIYKFETDKSFARLTKTSEEISWLQFAKSVATTGASYDFTKNRIEIYAGILGGVFFNVDWPNYLNYAAIGNVIGHELTHGFDDIGRQFGVNGELSNWWGNETTTKFREKADSIVQQYSNFAVEDVNMRLNGVNIQGEAICDIEGVKLAYKAYEKLVEDTGEEIGLPGLKYTSKQLFWLKVANLACTSDTKQLLIYKILNDPHPPNRYRVNGQMMNSVKFSKDFHCPENSPMNPKSKTFFYHQ